ncbi:MAG: carboxymuconolactone decarboxylase family protein [Candidatus Hadarchaeum sp.]|uniref:carboxymuconolactone decarboxylase family protein n=1 Tax=Candidatus Hadarchaeum sp. TaxID=2883567 RepID=UPI00316E2FAB
MVENDMQICYEQFIDLLKRMKEMDAEYTQALFEFTRQSEKPGALSTKEKELISIALSVAARCPSCIAFHVKNAIREGATKKEIYEAGFVAGLMGGGPAITYLRYLVDACDQFGAR